MSRTPEHSECKSTSLPFAWNVILVPVLSPSIRTDCGSPEEVIAMHSLHSMRRSLGRIISAFVFVCILTATANAYTVIMRGGRRLEIPANFIVTTSTLTYEVLTGVAENSKMRPGAPVRRPDGSDRERQEADGRGRQQEAGAGSSKNLRSKS